VPQHREPEKKPAMKLLLEHWREYLRENNNSEVVYEDDKVTIVYPRTPESSEQYAKGAWWTFAKAHNWRPPEKFSYGSMPYFILDKNPKVDFKSPDLSFKKIAVIGTPSEIGQRSVNRGKPRYEVEEVIDYNKNVLMRGYRGTQPGGFLGHFNDYTERTGEGLKDAANKNFEDRLEKDESAEIYLVSLIEDYIIPHAQKEIENLDRKDSEEPTYETPI